MARPDFDLPTFIRCERSGPVEKVPTIKGKREIIKKSPWEVDKNPKPLEKDKGKPVVSHWTEIYDK